MALLRSVAVVLSAAWAGWLAQTTPGATPGNGYVDSRVCARCHREIAANYAHTGMGRSFYMPDPLPPDTTSIQDYPQGGEFYHALCDSHCAMTIRNGQYFQRRWQLEARGKE